MQQRQALPHIGQRQPVAALTDAGRADPLLAGLPDVFAAYVGHKEAITTLPSGAVVLATGAACPVQMFRVGRAAYATQFHPEPTAKAFAERMDVYRNDGYFDAADYDALAAEVVRTSVTEPLRIIREFVRLFG